MTRKLQQQSWPRKHWMIHLETGLACGYSLVLASPWLAYPPDSIKPIASCSVLAVSSTRMRPAISSMDIILGGTSDKMNLPPHDFTALWRPRSTPNPVESIKERFLRLTITLGTPDFLSCWSKR